MAAGLFILWLSGQGMAEATTDPSTILVVDDDARLRSLLSDYLSESGFFVITAEDTRVAREKLQWFACDAIVLDRMLPGESGAEFAQSLRQKPAPILMLTAKGEAQDRISGLEAGVEDYLTKPFEPKELVLRLHNLLKRQVTAEPGTICRFGPYRFDLKRQELYRHEEIMYLTSAEKTYLLALAEQLGEPVSREALAERIRHIGETGNVRSVDVQIGRLRKKLETDPSRPLYIQTVRSAGYVLIGS